MERESPKMIYHIALIRPYLNLSTPSCGMCSFIFFFQKMLPFHGRYSTKIEVLELLKCTRDRLQVKVVAGGLAPIHSSSMAETLRRKGRGQEKRVSREVIAMRYEKAQLFHSKVSIFLNCSYGINGK